MKRLVGLVVVDHERRKILHLAAIPKPDRHWLIQQLLNAFPGECNYKYLICDNNRLFQTAFENDVKDLLGLKVRKIARFSPWMNGVTERTVGSIRRELLDHVMVLNEHHLNALLKKYKDYYNSARTHLKLDKDAPDVRPQEFQSESGNRITEKVFLGGLHHRYSWAS